MRQPVLTIMGLTLIASAWGCATTSAPLTTTQAAAHQPGLKSLDGDVVFTGETPEAPDGTVALQHEPAVASGLWMEDTFQHGVEVDPRNPAPRIKNPLKLMTPPDSGKVAWTYTKRRQ